MAYGFPSSPVRAELPKSSQLRFRSSATDDWDFPRAEIPLVEKKGRRLRSRPTVPCALQFHRKGAPYTVDPSCREEAIDSSTVPLVRT